MMATSRREFVKNCVAIAGLVSIVPALVSAEEKRRGGGAGTSAGGAAGGGDIDLPLVEPGKEMAAAMNYQHDKKNVKDAKLKTERSGTPFDKQSCSGCLLYTKVGNKGGDELGKCSIFAGKLVKSAGWCASWAKKA